MANTGNNIQDSSFMRAMLALKQNIMNDCHVADLAQVTKISDDSTKVQTLADGATITCTTLQDLQLKIGDIVLIVYVDTDFRSNLKRIKAGRKAERLTDVNSYHSNNFGVVTGIVYSKED